MTLKDFCSWIGIVWGLVLPLRISPAISPELLLKLVPGAKTIGTIYCSSEVNSQLQAELLKKYAAEKGVQVEERLYL